MLDESVVRLKSLTPVQSCSFNHLQSISKQGSSDISSKGVKFTISSNGARRESIRPRFPQVTLLRNQISQMNFPGTGRGLFQVENVLPSITHVPALLKSLRIVHFLGYFERATVFYNQHMCPKCIPSQNFTYLGALYFCFVLCSVSGRQWNLKTYQLPRLQASVAQLSRLSTIILSLVYIKFHFAFQPQL